MKITILKLRRDNYDNVNRELQWLGNSLGLFNLRDRDSSCFRIFISLVRRAKRNEATSSDQIAEQLNLTRGTVVHHLSKLMDSGLVVREGRRYILRERDLQQVIKDLQKDMDFVFSELNQVAKEIDEKLG
ncbi:MAG TPA: ArsR family transcriptional regulator [Candidatus Nanoarchaeia archaeon]|nr:ArsR family transcriptional regulator [Candidatus Nanoarchaeia archaeon]